MRFTFIQCLLAAVFANEYVPQWGHLAGEENIDLLGQVEPLTETELKSMRNAVRTTEGLLRGAISGSFPKLDSCIKDGGAIIRDVQSASRNLKSNNVRTVRQGLRNVGNAIYKARDALRNCRGSVGEIRRLERMAATFSTPETAIIHIGRDIIIHGVSIIREINAAVRAYDRGDFYNFGFNVGKAAAQILIGEEAPMQNKDTVKDVLEVIGGVVKGAIDAEFSDLDKCIEDGEDIIKDVESAVKHFKSKNIAEVIAGLKDVGDILTKVEDALKSCQAVEKDWKKLTEMAAYFSSPQGAIIHIGKDLVVHGVDIFKETMAAVHAMEHKKYYDFGYNVGKAAAHILLGEEQQEVESTLEDVLEVVGGVLKGAIDADFSDLDKCIEDGTGIVEDVESAVNHFKSKNVKDIIAGLKDVGDILTKVEDALTSCQAIEGDFKKLKEMAVYFSSPQGALIHIGKDIIVHGTDIYKEVTAAVKAMEDKQYYNFGYNVGKAGAQILLGEQKLEATAHDIVKVIEGVIKGAVDVEFSDLDQCIQDGVDIIDDVWDAVEKFQSKNPEEVVKGIKDIGLILEKAGAAITDCKDIKEADLSKLTELAAYFSDPQTAIVHIGKDIVVHGVDIIKEVTAAVKAMEQKDFYDFGLNIGKAAAQILIGAEVVIEEVFIYEAPQSVEVFVIEEPLDTLQ